MKPRNKVNKRSITVLLIGLGFLTVILLAAMIAASQDANNKNYNSNISDKEGDTTDIDSDGKILCVVKSIDIDQQLVTLFDIASKEELTLSYHGGTNITDKYNKIMSMSQIPLGVMVDVSYEPGDNKLTSMNLSTKAWENVKVNHMNIDIKNQVMKIASTQYKYNSGLSVLDGEEFVSVNSLADQDELTVWGYDQTIWSVIIKKGHGTVKLENYEDYLGNNIKVGYEGIQRIVDGLEITAREGECNLTVENGLYSATKSIMINKNQVTYVSLNDLGPVGPNTGLVLFQVTPYGADLYVDGKAASYTDTLKLEYGEHSVKVALGGYNTYEGTIYIDSDSKTIKVKLPEETSDEDATATETDPSSPTSGTVTPSPQGTDNENTNTTNKIYVQTPAAASVYFDGSYIGTAPCSYKKVMGTHVLTFIKEGYETKSYTVDIVDDKVDAYFKYDELTKTPIN